MRQTISVALDDKELDIVDSVSNEKGYNRSQTLRYIIKRYIFYKIKELAEDEQN